MAPLPGRPMTPQELVAAAERDAEERRANALEAAARMRLPELRPKPLARATEDRRGIQPTLADLQAQRR